MKVIQLLIITGLFILLSHSAHASTAAVDQFIDEMVQKHQFERAYLQKVLATADKKQSILDLMSRAPERSKHWYEYRKIFIIPKRIQGGVEFWDKNQQALARAQQIYGVDAEIIVAIIGVETFYGGNTGNTRVLDALYTLGFSYPGKESAYRVKREKFFRIQLEQFLLLAREENIDPGQLKGSYAGAMGRAQFMPDSYRDYAVDFNNDGKRDIWNNDTDAIGSVANFLSKKGKWKAGLPITTRVGDVNKSHQPLVDAGIKPAMSIGELREAGIDVSSEYPDALKSSLIALRNSAGMEHWAGMENFYAITRYNNSQMYAMAVYQLAQAISEKR